MLNALGKSKDIRTMNDRYNKLSVDYHERKWKTESLDVFI